MADITNLSGFLSDVANAIRTKKETTEQIPAENFDQEILSIDTIKGQEKTIIPSTAEQIITPDGDYNAITKATIKAVDNTIDSNISPENIKKDINILGVTGTLEEGEQINNQDKEITTNGTYTADEGYTGLGTVTVNVPQTGDVPVKLFETEEQMQADTTAKEGDLAIVYNSEYVPTKAKTTVDTVMFPKTVTLANKVTKNITGRVICVDNHRLECSIELTATSYTIRQEDRRPVKTIVEYTSTDGITYIRKTTLADDMYTFDSAYEWRTSWSNEILDNFVLTIRKTFSGLFDYRTGLDNNYIELYGNVVVSGYNKYTADIENIKIDKLTKIAYKIEDELGVPKLYVVIKNDSGMFLYRYPDAGVPGVIVYGNDYYRISQNYTREPKSSVDKYTLDLENMTYTKTTLQASSTYEYQTVYETIPKTSLIGILNLTNYSDTLAMFGHNDSSSTSTYPMLNTRRTNINMTYGTFTKYLIAESQLDDIRPSDLLLGKTGYGSLGVVTGDGSILNVMNKSDLIKNMYGKNNTIYGKAWDRTLARIYNNIAITNEKLNEMTNNMIVPIKLSAYTSDGLNHISLFDKTTESAYSVFSRDYTKYIEPDVSNSRLYIKDTDTGNIIYSYDMVFANPYDSSKKSNIINIYDDTYIAWSCTSTVGHVYKFNLHEDNVEHTEIDLGGTYKNYKPFNVFAYNNGKLYLAIRVDTTLGSVCKYELGYVNVSDMTYHSILSKSVNYYSTAYAWSANITSNKDILAYFSIYKDSSSGSSKYWGYLIDSEDNILKSVENSSSTLNEVNFSKTYPDSQRILYDDGTYLYSSSNKVNKSTLIATKETSSYPWHSSYDFSYLFDSHNVYTGENYGNVINMPEIYTGSIYHFDGSSTFTQSAMPLGDSFIWGLEDRSAYLRGSYDFTIGTFDDYDMLLVRPFAANGDTELKQYMFIDKTQYKNTISPTEYNTAVATTEDILGNTTE